MATFSGTMNDLTKGLLSSCSRRWHTVDMTTATLSTMDILEIGHCHRMLHCHQMLDQMECGEAFRDRISDRVRAQSVRNDSKRVIAR